MNKAGVALDRKILAELAAGRSPADFAAVVQAAAGLGRGHWLDLVSQTRRPWPRSARARHRGRRGREGALEELRVRFLGKKGELSAGAPRHGAARAPRSCAPRSARSRTASATRSRRCSTRARPELEDAGARGRAVRARRIDVTAAGRGRCSRAATATPSPGPPRRSPPSSPASGTRWRAVRRSSSTRTTSRRSTSRPITPRGTCRTRSTWTSPRSRSGVKPGPVLLRTHTSPVQIRAMQRLGKPPVRDDLPGPRLPLATTTRPTRPCSTRSRGCASDRASPSPT